MVCWRGMTYCFPNSRVSETVPCALSGQQAYTIVAAKPRGEFAYGVDRFTAAWEVRAQQIDPRHVRSCRALLMSDQRHHRRELGRREFPFSMEIPIHPLFQYTASLLRPRV